MPPKTYKAKPGMLAGMLTSRKPATAAQVAHAYALTSRREGFPTDWRSYPAR
jgi:hypothetical protein